MKKRIALCLLLCLALCLALPLNARAESALDYVTDTAGLLTDSQRSALNSTAASISQQYQCGVYIITVDDYKNYNPSSVAECAESLYVYYGLGQGEERNGVLLLLSMAERDFDIAAYGDFGNYSFTDYGKDRMADEFLDNFRNNDWYGGFEDYLDVCARYLSAAKQGEPYDISGGSTGMPMPLKLLIVIGVPILVALIACGSMKAKMKTAREKTTAEEYLVPNSLNLRIREDRFVNRTQHVEIIQESSSRSGGHGGTTVGGSGFSHHSGKF